MNINKQKKDAFQILKPELDVDPEKNPHFDARMGIDSKKLLRHKRASFLFVEEGKWSKEAEIVKLKVVLTWFYPFLVSKFMVLIVVAINTRVNLEKHKPRS